MIEVFVGSTNKYAGKTVVVLGILEHLKSRGMKIGYFKPIGKNFIYKGGERVEGDALLIKDHFSLEDELSLMCPVYLDYSDYTDVALGKTRDVQSDIYGAYEQLKRNKDVIVIGGGQDLFDGYSIGISNIHFIEKLNLPLVLVDSPAFGEINLDAIAAIRDRMGEKLMGVVLNRLQPERVDFIKKTFVPFLESKSINVLGLVPFNPKLTSLTIGEIREALGGEIICCDDRIEEAVENFMVGAMNVESALKYFRSQGNKAVITGGDRADIELAALETPTKVLILTGGLYPETRIISTAQEKGVPIIVVGDDTLTVVDKVESAVRGVGVRGHRVQESINTFQMFVDTAFLEELLRKHKG
ncbi:phosphotransacetylase family protein [Chloroflexota bacterium]